VGQPASFRSSPGWNPRNSVGVVMCAIERYWGFHIMLTIIGAPPPLDSRFRGNDVFWSVVVIFKWIRVLIGVVFVVDLGQIA
jgi:hypothetical protein